ncbi:decaprenyl-phosphate phosphoribosyltransferase [Rhodocyclaceae bacterium]|nr:decaprenyl-phosphate phosphoribosyltransferase [Rhodocyclaceae bacterium]
MLKAIIECARPHQWLKNGFVFIGPVFAHRWDAETLGLSALVFVSFCLISSAVYVLNDIFDLHSDRAHPIKRLRPLPSGKISIPAAWMLSVGLALPALALSALTSLWALLFVVLYVLCNIGYSMSWKHVAVLDVFLISLGFMLRILTGTIGLGIAPSSWLLLTGLMVTLFLGFAKRWAEIRMLNNAEHRNPAPTRQVLSHYSPAMIDLYMAVSAACTIMTYSLYAASPETAARLGTNALIFTIPLVVYGIFRYIYLLHSKGKGHDAARDLYNDPHLLITFLIWLAATLVVLA